MTANKNLKRVIRRRMQSTGESYTAARRHFLISKDLNMTQRANVTANPRLQLSVERLQLTLKTTRLLQAHGIEHISQLLDPGSLPAGLDPLARVELREVLASRGLP